MKIKTLLFCLFLSFGIHAQDKEPIAKVSVYVSGDESIEGKIKSHIKRELRALQDIHIYTPNDSTYYKIPSMTIEIVCMENYLENGDKIGYSLAIYISRSFISDIYDMVTLSSLECEEKFNFDVFSEKLRKDGYPIIQLDLWLRTTNTGGLKGICEGIVADVDNEFFEQLR